MFRFKYQVQYGQSNIALVSIVMGSRSDFAGCMEECCKELDALKIPFELRVVSAHRTVDRLHEYAKNVSSRGVNVVIAGAGGAAHLPGMIAAITLVPVIGIPVQSKALSGIDSLFSIVQMPPGVPVNTMAIGASGAKNAAIYAAQILALFKPEVRLSLLQYRQNLTDSVPEDAYDTIAHEAS
jgi:5-(carboxyamino)imidazole ribonucleotide mutase